MANLRELVEKRSAARDTIKRLAAQFEANGKRWESDTDRRQWDNVNATYDRLSAELDAAKANEQSACAAALAAHTPRTFDDGDGIVWKGKSSDDEFDALIRSRKAGRIEVRASTTTLAGATTGVLSDAGPLSPYLTDQCGVRLVVAENYTLESPYFAALTAQSATSEGGTKPVHGDPTLKTSTLAAYAVTHTISDQVATYGVGSGVFGRRLQSEVVYSINEAAATAFETEAGTPITFVASSSAGYMVDLGIATVASLTGNLPSGILVNPANYPELASKLAASGGDIGSRVVSWNGVPLFAHSTITSGVAVIVDGLGWRAARGPMRLDSQPQLTTNQLVLRAEQYATLVPLFANCARAVALA